MPAMLRRVSPVMPAPALDALGRPTQPWEPSSVLREDLGRWRLLVSGQDVTFFRGVPFVLRDFADEEPFGDVTATLEFPQITPFEQSGVGDLAWLVDFAPIEIQLVGPDDVTVLDTVWVGNLGSLVTTDGTGNAGTSLPCQGSLFQASLTMHQPPFYLVPTDVGMLVPLELNYTPQRRFGSIAGVTTGINSSTRGDRSQTRIDYCQALLATATDVDGSQWTVAQTPGTKVFTFRKKDVTTVHATFTLGTPGLQVDLTRDPTQAPNVLYGEWTTPDGCVGRNSKYPNLLPDSAPDYPFDNPDDVITVGTADADTDSGNGVSTWQQRMHDIGYPVAVTGTYSSSDATYCRREQAAAGIQVDGVVGPQTWAATFDVGANGGDLSGAYFAPISEDMAVEPNLHTPQGAIIGPNPDWQPGKMRVERFLQLGDGITRDQAIASADSERARDADPGLTGTITADVDPEEGSRLLLRSGQNILLKSFRGADVMLHIARRDVAGTTVTYTVDSKARDALTLAQIIERNNTTNQDPARQYRAPSTATTVKTSATWDCEAGSGIVPRFALFGGLWSVIRIPMAEYGTVARSTIQTVSPASEFALLAFERQITAADLVNLVGNPLADGNNWSSDKATSDALDARGLRMAWGGFDQPGGYSPGSFSNGDPLTGLLDDTASWSFVSGNPPWVWLAFYSPTSCFASGKFLQAVQ